MSKNVDLIGKRHGRIVVVEYLGLRKRTDGRNNKIWLCRCDCGNEKIYTTNEIQNGHIKSCGCYKKQYLHEKFWRGGRSKLYDVWKQMCKRCYDENSRYYYNYGGRGISICEEWQDIDGYYRFKEWAEQNGYQEGLTIDRIDNNGDYCPENCSWETMKHQSNNKRNNRRFTIDGVT